jgi:transcriptional regulator with XRE-family HTH domain
MTTGTPLVAPGTVRLVAGRSLTADENERVIAAVRKLLVDADGNQSALARELKSKQSTISGLLLGRHRAGYGFARSVAARLRIDVDDLLGTVRREYDRDPALPPNALGHHADWKRAREEALARFGRFIDEALLDEVAAMQLSRMPERLSAEAVKQFHDALATARGG